MEAITLSMLMEGSFSAQESGVNRSEKKRKWKKRPLVFQTAELTDKSLVLPVGGDSKQSTQGISATILCS